VFPATGGSGTAVVLNNYDGSPVNFASGDIVVAMALSNASSAYAASAPYNFPNSFTGASSGSTNVVFNTAELPTLNPATLIWANGTSRQALTGNVLLLSLYPNVGVPPTVTTNPPVALNVGITSSAGIATSGSAYPNAAWLNCVYANIPSTTGVTYAINVTMLVINPHLAQ
jgi:hypothetical protein